MLKQDAPRATEKTTVLVADDDPSIRKLLRYNLEREGFHVVLASDGREALARLTDDTAVALLDLRMPVMDGFECLREIRRATGDTQVIIITASHELADAVSAMKQGAFDYVTKPLDFEALVALLRQAAHTTRLSRENRQLRQAIGVAKPVTSFIGDAPEIRSLLTRAKQAARLDATVLITGESGAGKGLLARMVHYSSDRADKPFVAVNCVALPRELVESELFGHEKGAFTGAHERRLGRLEIADGGTVFLDEIGDMPLDLQPKLLTFLQENAFQRVGGNDTVSVDVRVITATHQDLPRLCRDREFREDLYFRINVLPLHLPPLRSRKEDIPALVRYILERIGERRKMPTMTLADDALRALTTYPWPGNIRELENVLERSSAFCAGQTINLDDLPAEIRSTAPPDRPRETSLAGRPLADIERDAILQTLDLCGGNKAEVARRLGISEKSIYNKMKRYELQSSR